MGNYRHSVAVVDDDPVYRKFVSLILEKGAGIDVLEASCEEDLIKILNQQPIDCILLDYNLGVDNGFSVKERLNGRFSVLPPVVMLTGDGRERTVIRALRLGIDDYVSKRDLKAEDLLSAINHAVAKGRKDQLARAEYQRLVHASGLDPVTRLPGRTQLDERLAHLAALPPKSRAGYAIALIQINELADINTSLGLKVGDQALRAFGERLQRLTRASDVCGRFTGRTFLVIIDARSSPDVLDGVCRRFADGLAFRLDVDAVGLDMSPQIGGVMCSHVAPHGVLIAADLVQAARDTLEKGLARGVPFHVIGAPCDVTPEPQVNDGPVKEMVQPEPGTPSRPAADQLRTSDRREKPRHRVLKRGQIILSINSAIDCAVRNLSDSGAGLRIDGIFPMPREFDLVIGDSGVKRRVRIQWQVGNDLGVVFLK